MKQPPKPSASQPSPSRQEQRLDAFWRKALAAAPEAPIDAGKLATARAAIFAAAEQLSPPHQRRLHNPWHLLKTWWSAGAQGIAPPRWATGFASITLASLVLVLWYERMPEPAWDFDSANVGSAATPAPALAPAPMAESAPAAAMSAPQSTSADERSRAMAKQAPEARLQAAPNRTMAEAPSVRKVLTPEHNQRAPKSPITAPLADVARAHGSQTSSITLLGQADTAKSTMAVQNHTLLAQVQASNRIAWRANARSLFSALDAKQTTALLALLEPLAQQATHLPQLNDQPQVSLRRNSLQLLLKQSDQISLITHIMREPHYQIDWFNAQNEWLGSTPINEAAYNRITTTITSP